MAEAGVIITTPVNWPGVGSGSGSSHKAIRAILPSPRNPSGRRLCQIRTLQGRTLRLTHIHSLSSLPLPQTSGGTTGRLNLTQPAGRTETTFGSEEVGSLWLLRYTGPSVSNGESIKMLRFHTLNIVSGGCGGSTFPESLRDKLQVDQFPTGPQGVRILYYP